jgi:asparagine synthase (glutamine-hydrolysing)
MLQQLKDRAARGWDRLHLSAVSRAVRREHLTYLTATKLRSLEECIRLIDAEQVPGRCLELGVALGGSAIVIATLARRRQFTGYDVFGMIPPPGPRDDPKSHERYEVIASGKSQGIQGDDYYGYQPELRERVVRAFRRYGLEVDGDRIGLVEGLFEDTLLLEGGGPIALAHIDCDWYEPVKLAIERIYPMLSPGGFLVFDDYLDYGGCRRAVHEFLSGRDDAVVSRISGHLVARRSR